MENIVLSIFAVESEAYQAFSELTKAPEGNGYAIAEAVLLKSANGRVEALEGYGFDEGASNDTATGMLVGSLVGILGGPIGVLLGATAGGLVGNTVDAEDVADYASAIEIVASKLFDGEVAIVARVNEEEPAFDEAFRKYQTTIIRYDAADIVKEVAHARELEEEVSRQAREKLRAERKAARAAHFEESRAMVEEQAQAYGNAVFNAVDQSK